MGIRPTMAALATAMFAAGIASAAAQPAGIPSTPEDPMPEYSQARAPLEYIQAYQSVCEDLRNRNAKNAVLTRLTGKEDEQFRGAIGEFCASGVFVLSGAENGACKERRKLAPRHTEFLRNLRWIRGEPNLRLLSLDCIDFQGAALTLMNLDGGALQLKNATVQRVYLAYSKLPGGVKLENVDVQAGLGIYASSVTSPITIAQSEIGKNPTWELAVGIVSSTVDNVTFNNVKIKGKLDISGLSASDNVTLNNGTRVDERFYGRGAKIAGALVVKDATIGGVTTLDYGSIGRIEFDKGKFEAEVYLDYAHVERQVLMRNETSFSKNLSANFIKAPDFHIEKVGFVRSISLQNAQIGSFALRDSNTTDPLCKNCDLWIGNANINTFRYLRSRGFNIRAGNGRFRTFDATYGSVGIFNCTDCLVEHYLLIASKMTGLTDLTGADIRGTLLLSDGNARACWTEAAELNISELRADAIAANAQDLMVDKQQDAPECTKASGAFVRTHMTGARYRALTPGRFEKAKLDAADPYSRPLVELGSSRLIGFIRSNRQGKESSRIAGKTSGARMERVKVESEGAGKLTAEGTSDSSPQRVESYDPQPYEELAKALDRAGESEKAIDLRVAKIDARLEGETNPLIQAWYWLYKLISRYGFENGRAAVIFLALLCIGAIVYGSARAGDLSRLWQRRRFGALFGLTLYGFWFSLDRAIPPLHLDPHMHDNSGLPWNARNYFYCHRVAGTLLLSVAAAGAAGLGH